MKILGIETSCDETAAAVVENGVQMRSNIIASQNEHIKYGGVVPELASRAHIRLVLPVIQEALTEAGLELHQIDGFAVTMGPGLIGSLLVGVSAAKALALAQAKPVIGIHHLEGHIFANFIADPTLEPPFICLLVSGGHSEVIFVKARGDYQILGRTRDDAAGEAFDKVAKMLKLSYPGGPAIEKAAQDGNSKAIAFPIARMKNAAYDFSFSGLKTAVHLFLAEKGSTWVEENMADLAASFQEAVVEALVQKTLQAARDCGVARIVLAGGVACNSRLRQMMRESAGRENVAVFYPPLNLCTDNAAMIAAAGHFRLSRGERADLRLNAQPSLRLDNPTV